MVVISQWMTHFQDNDWVRYEISIRKRLIDKISRAGGLFSTFPRHFPVDDSGKYFDLPDSQNFRLVIEVKKRYSANFYQNIFRTRISENQNTQNDAYLIVYYPERSLSAFLFFWPNSETFHFHLSALTHLSAISRLLSNDQKWILRSQISKDFYLFAKWPIQKNLKIG